MKNYEYNKMIYGSQGKKMRWKGASICKWNAGNNQSKEA